MRFTSNTGLRFIIILIIIGTIISPIFNYGQSTSSISRPADASKDAESHMEKPDMGAGKSDKKTRGSITRRERPETVMDKVKESFVYARLLRDTAYYDSYAKNRNKIGQFDQGERLEIIRDRGYEWYLVKNDDGEEGWIEKDSISIPEDPETNEDRMTKAEIEEYINNMGFTSDTCQLIWVDLDRQLTHVLLDEDGRWKHDRSILSSTGTNISPTMKGIFKIEDRHTEFFTERLGSGAKNWVRYEGPYLFHSLPVDKQGNIIDYTLGKRASDGCIRMSMEDSEWFYENIEEASTVFVN